MCGVLLGRGAGSTTEAAAQRNTEYRQGGAGVGRGVIRLQRQQDAATIKIRVDVAQRSDLGTFIPRHFSSSLLVRVPRFGTRTFRSRWLYALYGGPSGFFPVRLGDDAIVEFEKYKYCSSGYRNASFTVRASGLQVNSYYVFTTNITSIRPHHDIPAKPTPYPLPSPWPRS